MYGTWVTLQKGTLSLTYKYGRATGGLDRAVCEISAKTVLVCPRAAVHRTSSQAPRSYHVLHSNRDTRSITSRALGLGAGRADARLNDGFDDRQFTGSTCDALRAFLCAPLRGERLCGAPPLRAAAIPYCAALRAAARARLGAPLAAARSLGRSAPLRGAPRRSAPLHPSLLDEHRCAP